MKKSVCKIFWPKYGTGFFCNLEINEDKIPVLITNYHIIDDEFVEKNNKLKFQLGNDKILRIINLNKNKKLYSSTIKEYDIMIIKIDKGDRIDNIEYLEIDETFLDDDLELDYGDNSIYILHYPCGDEIKVSYGRGFIKNEKNDFEIFINVKLIQALLAHRYLIYQQIKLLEYIKLMRKVYVII